MDKQRRYDLYKGAVAPGWCPILDRYVPMVLDADPDVYLYIKEKYGLLRIEMSSKIISPDRQIAWENAAERESASVCECCGRPGRLREDLDWLLTLCDECCRLDRLERREIEAEAEKRWWDGKDDPTG